MKVLSIFAVLLLLITFSSAQDSAVRTRLDSLQEKLEILNEKVEKLQSESQQNEIEKLREAAQKRAQSPESAQGEVKQKTFREGSRSLQALNPEISVTGDMLTRYLSDPPHSTEDARTGFRFRVLGLHIQSNLDPFSMAKVALEFSPEEIGVGEAYMTWINPFSRVNLTAGKFRQQFGIINRWHEHALDQVAFPLPIELYLGEEGLVQTGVSLSWLLPRLTASANELTLQITNSSNEHLFGGREYSPPATLFHFKNYYDLSRDTYLEWGISGIAGTNDNLGFTFARAHRWTYLGGLDLTISWSPVKRALYKGITWRSEIFYLNKQIETGSRIKALGGYSYMDYRLSRRFILGIRGDIAQPPVTENSDQFLWQVVPYLTFWQSEFVFLRFQFNHLEGYRIAEKDNRFTLQIDWAVGPHKHERY